MQNLLKQLVYQWQSQDIRFQKGVSNEKIHALEEKLGYFFPKEFTFYLQTLNGMEDGEADHDLFYFWSSELIAKEIKEHKPAGPDSIFVGFADRIVIESVYMIEISKTRQLSGRISIQKKDNKIISQNFHAFLDGYLNNLGKKLPSWEKPFAKEKSQSPFTLLCEHLMPGPLATV